MEVIGKAGNLERFTSEFGYVKKDLEKTDLATFAFGMIAGTLIRLVTVS